MAIYRTDEDYAKRAALARALREYADAVEQGAPSVNPPSYFWRKDDEVQPPDIPNSLHISFTHRDTGSASFWIAALVPYTMGFDPGYSDDRGPSHLRGKYAHVGADDIASRLKEIKAQIASVGGDPDAVDQVLNPRPINPWALDPKKVEQFQQFAEGLAAEQQAAHHVAAAVDTQFVERLAATLRPGAEAGEALKQAFGSCGPFPRSSEDTATEQQAADSAPPPWRDRLKSSEMAQLALAEAYSHDLQTIPDETRGTHGKALKTIAALVQILDERE